MDFRVAPQAESDLDEIWYFLATQSSSIDVADRVIDSITARFALLARQPYIGRAATIYVNASRPPDVTPIGWSSGKSRTRCEAPVPTVI